MKPNVMQPIESATIESMHFQPNLISPPNHGTSTPRPRQINFSLSDEFSSAERKPLGQLIGISSTKSEDVSAIKIEDLQVEISKLQERLATALKLETDVSNLRTSLEQVTKEKETITSELTQQKDSAANLRLDLAAKSKIIDDVMAEKKVLQSELSDIKLKLSKLNIVHSELKSLQAESDARNQEFDELSRRFKDKCRETEELLKKMDSVTGEVDILNQQIVSLNKTISHKDELLTKHEKNALNYAQNETLYLDKLNRLDEEKQTAKRNADPETGIESIVDVKQELEETKAKLFELMIDYERLRLDVKDRSAGHSPRTKISSLNATEQLSLEQEKNQQLEHEIGVLKDALLRNENSSSPKPFLLDEIAESVEKELNYSAQLDSNILKAIESDEINSDEDNLSDRLIQPKYAKEFAIDDDVMSELRAIKQKYEIERSNCLRLQRLLDAEKRSSGSLQEQDANIIDAMRIRLEEALAQEAYMQKVIDDERAKSERLGAQVVVYQRTVSRDNSLLLKSPPDSPRRMQRTSEFDVELANRLQSEVKLLTAQNDREKERVMDLERVIEREKNRFEKELTDRKDYGDRIKREMDRVLKEKEILANDLEHAQER